MSSFWQWTNHFFHHNFYSDDQFQAHLRQPSANNSSRGRNISSNIIFTSTTREKVVLFLRLYSYDDKNGNKLAQKKLYVYLCYFLIVLIIPTINILWLSCSCYEQTTKIGFTIRHQENRLLLERREPQRQRSRIRRTWTYSNTSHQNERLNQSRW